MKIEKAKILALLKEDYDKLNRSLRFETDKTKIDYTRGGMIYIKILAKSIEEMKD